MTVLTKGLNRKLFETLASDDGLVIVPFGFVINGTTDPDGLSGDMLKTVTRNEAGEMLCTLKSTAAACFFGDAQLSNTADDVDLYCKVDWTNVTVDGTFVVRFMTGGTETDPTDNTAVGGFLLCKKTKRTTRNIP